MTARTYEDVFTSRPATTAEAPGRVNLLGEHTDYNDGFVLPIAIPARTRVTVGHAAQRGFTVYSANLDRAATFTHDEAPADAFASYVYGCVRMLMEEGADVPPLDLHVSSEVPIGAGLSSSAALEVAVLRALRDLLALDVDDVRLALLAQQAEVRYANVQCGIMDQMAASLADERHMLFIDTRTLDHRALPLPGGAALLVIDSGVSRRLAAGAYNRRRDECRAAAQALGVPALRDVADPAAVETLPDPLRRRARHVVAENARVLRAAQGVAASEFGALMNASHDSLRDDFEVSHPALDALVALLRAQPAVHGARLTGAGFGGACVALCRGGTADAVAAPVLASFAASGGRGRQLVPPPVAAHPMAEGAR